jgi:hypothetical protein
MIYFIIVSRRLYIIKRLIKRVGKGISILLPINVYRILVKLYSDLYGTRTNEIIRIIGDRNYGSYLEVGVWRGDNLLPIAKKYPNLVCYGVDPYSGSNYEEYYKEENMQMVDGIYYEKLFQDILVRTKKFKNINIIRKTSKVAVNDFSDQSLDIVFIDAKHDYKSVSEDIRIWLPKVKIGGVLCGHDYSLRYFGVVEAVNKIIGYDNVVIKRDATFFYTKR